MMVASISTATSNGNATPKISADRRKPNQKPPLLPLEKDNGVVSRKPKSREITSRYLSSSPSPSSSSKSFPSPVVSSRVTPEPSVKRSQSVDRRRPKTPIPDSKLVSGVSVPDLSSASKVLITSTRSLSVSFQGESFSLPISKTKTPNPNVNAARKFTPEKRRPTPTKGKNNHGTVDPVENSKITIDQHRWPAATKKINPLTRSLDCGNDIRKSVGSVPAIRALKQSLIDEGRRSSFDSKLQVDLSNIEISKSISSKTVGSPLVTRSDNVAPSNSCEVVTSDSESVSSGSNSGIQEFSLPPRIRGLTRGITVPARFLSEMNVRFSGSKMVTTPKSIPSKKVLSDSSLFSPRMTPTNRTSSPLRGPVRYPSPSKFSVSSSSPSSRGTPSPSRTRGTNASSVICQPNNVPSVLSFSIDVRRGRMGENRIEDAHLLRLLHNRYLQWRFVNAKAEASLLIQTLAVERYLYNAWVVTSELLGTLTFKRIKLQLLQQNLKLSSILKGQMPYLEEWSALERNHYTSMSGALEALRASTLRLPVVGGARADLSKMKDAVNLAVDVMQSMGSTICSLLSKAEGINSSVGQLAQVASQERALLTQCKNLLSEIIAMEVKDCSLRSQLLQLKRTRLTQH